MDFHLQRIKKVQVLLKEISCDALIIDDQINLYYLTGQFISSGTLLVHSNGAELFVDNRYYEMCKKSCSFSIHLVKDKQSIYGLLFSSKFNFIKNLGFCSQHTTYGGFLELQKNIKKIKKNIHLKGIENPIAKLRTIKDSYEIQILREAVHLGSEGYDFVCSLLKPGITEAEIAVELEVFWKRRGSKTIAFDPIIAFGSNSSMPHYHTGATSLQRGESVLIDIGVNYKHYHSDMTRVVFFGDPDPKILEIYDVVQRAQKAALEICTPGTTIEALDTIARKIIGDEGYGENFTHSLGHGVGLEIHEYPIIRNKSPFSEVTLRPGMVLTIEPGIYLPGIGGVRLEDTVVITDKGHENLTNRSVDLQFLTL